MNKFPSPLIRFALVMIFLLIVRLMWSNFHYFLMELREKSERHETSDIDTFMSLKLSISLSLALTLTLIYVHLFYFHTPYLSRHFLQQWLATALKFGDENGRNFFRNPLNANWNILNNKLTNLRPFLWWVKTNLRYPRCEEVHFELNNNLCEFLVSVAFRKCFCEKYYNC